ncbi:Interleukin 34 [Aix galericulata]|nr:Interleukin 34 [Aix galericulata]
MGTLGHVGTRQGTLHGDTASLTPTTPTAGGSRRGATTERRPLSPVPRPLRPPAMQAAPPPAPAVTMHQGYAAVLCVLAVLRLEAAALGECELARLLQDQLGYEKRLQYTVPGLPASPHASGGSLRLWGGPEARPPPRQPLVLFPPRPPSHPGRSTTSPSGTRCGCSTRRC